MDGVLVEAREHVVEHVHVGGRIGHELVDAVDLGQPGVLELVLGVLQAARLGGPVDLGERGAAADDWLLARLDGPHERHLVIEVDGGLGVRVCPADRGARPRGLLAEEPASVVVRRHREPSAGVEVEARLLDGRADPVAGLHGPVPIGAVLLAPGVPVDGVGVDALGAQARAGGLAQRGRPAAVAAPALRRLRHLGHVLALGQDGGRVALDAVDRHPGRPRDVVGGLAGADAGLDLPWRQGTVHLASPRILPGCPGL